MKRWLWLLLPLLLVGCGRQGGLSGSFDRGGTVYRFDGRVLTVMGERFPYEERDGQLILTRLEGEAPFVCPFTWDEAAGVLYLNGLPFYRIDR